LGRDVGVGFVTSQVAAMDTVEVRHLWLVSTLLGLAYGSLFNVLPMLVLEWFGMGRSSEHPRHESNGHNRKEPYLVVSVGPPRVRGTGGLTL
jgi:hypothetical protein